MVSFWTRAAVVAVATASSATAQLQRVDNFGDTFNTQLIMELYVPPQPAESPAVILAVSSSE